MYLLWNQLWWSLLMEKYNCVEEFKALRESVFQNDLDFDIKTSLHFDGCHSWGITRSEESKQCSNCVWVNEDVHTEPWFLRFTSCCGYLTVPITSSTSERPLSSLIRLLTYLRSTMTEKRLNNCLLLHIHKYLTDSLDLYEIARDFISANEERQIYFGSFTLQ